MNFDAVTFVTVCSICDRVLLYFLNVEDSHEGDTFENAVLAYPETHLHEAVPEAVRRIYHEAMQVRERSPIAYAILIRKGLEEICNEQKIGDSSQKLSVRLNLLAKAHDMPPRLLKIGEIMKLLGNAAAHRQGELHRGQIVALREFFEIFTEYVYVLPARIKTFDAQWATLQKELDTLKGSPKSP